MKYCSNCQNVMEDDSQKFCSVCGNFLSEKEVCPECHSENSIDSSFCEKCGAPLKRQPDISKITPSETFNQINTRKSGRGSMIIIAITLVVLAVAGAAFYFLSNTYFKSPAAASQNDSSDVLAEVMIQAVKNEQIKNFPGVVDGAALIKPDDKKKLVDFLKKIENKHDIRCAVVTVKSTRGMIIKNFSDAVQDKYYSDAKTGSILMVIDMEKKHWHITTDYRMRKIITDDMVTGSLKNAFITHLKQGNYTDAFFAYGKKVDELMTK